MEKIKLNFREQQYNSFSAGLRTACANANNLLREILKICEFKIPENFITDIYAGAGEQTATRLEEKVRKELSTAGISSSTVIASAVNGDLEKFYTFINSKKPIEYDYLQYLVIDKQQVSIKENALDELKEAFTTYITIERGKDL